MNKITKKQVFAVLLGVFCAAIIFPIASVKAQTSGSSLDSIQSMIDSLRKRMEGISVSAKSVIASQKSTITNTAASLQSEGFGATSGAKVKSAIDTALSAGWKDISSSIANGTSTSSAGFNAAGIADSVRLMIKNLTGYLSSKDGFNQSGLAVSMPVTMFNGTVKSISGDEIVVNGYNNTDNTVDTTGAKVTDSQGLLSDLSKLKIGDSVMISGKTSGGVVQTPLIADISLAAGTPTPSDSAAGGGLTTLDQTAPATTNNGTTVTVGPSGTYQTDGNADQQQVNQALGSANTVRVIGSISVSDSIIIPQGKTLIVDGAITAAAGCARPLIYSVADSVKVSSSTALGGKIVGKSGIPAIIQFSGNKTEISNLDIGISGNHCVYLDSSSDSKVLNNKVHDCANNTTASALGVGILLWQGGNGNTVSGNTVNNTGLHGIQVHNGDNDTISNNNITTVYNGFGVSIFGEGGQIAENDVVSGNTVNGSRLECINANGAKNVKFLNNKCYNGKVDYGMSVWVVNGGEIAGNWIENAFKSGLTLDASSNMYVHDNTLKNNVAGGAGSDQRAHLFIWASLSGSCLNNRIINNTITETRSPRNVIYGIQEGASSGMQANYSTIQGNTISGYSNQAISTIGPNTVVSGNNILGK